METNEQAFYAESPWTWKERLLFKLFPSRYCELPEAPATYADCLVVKTTVVFGVMDRVRTLLTGRVVVETKTVTENAIGNHVTGSVAYPTTK